MRKFKLVLAGFAVATLGLVGAAAPAHAGGQSAVSAKNVWCC
ncbi:hypothetical protein BJ993_004602 [Nocardioides aromaticivorans]|uniref:Uncharacterized protein n=1 Tax=Nocardioides aromaticivorans TaxID=200618 RepID=A0A7Z0CR58_9ACTN|nr:hypothetical protein [Nocardioides aromaticivorans]NYI47522.1 hypothetical protein [Nocardioides aromaticivorans]